MRRRCNGSRSKWVRGQEVTAAAASKQGGSMTAPGLPKPTAAATSTHPTAIPLPQPLPLSKALPSFLGLGRQRGGGGGVPLGTEIQPSRREQEHHLQPPPLQQQQHGNGPGRQRGVIRGREGGGQWRGQADRQVCSPFP